MLSSYIKVIFFEYGKAVIPGLGTLTSIPKGSAKQENSHILIPPSSEINFSEYIDDHELEKLIYFIVHKEKITQEDAQQKVNKFVEETQVRLNLDQVVDLADIGIFTKEKDGKLTFEQKEGIYSKDSHFGLPKIQARPLESKPTEDTKFVDKKHSQQSTLWLIVVPLILIFAFGVYISIDLQSRQQFFSLGKRIVQKISKTTQNSVGQTTEKTKGKTTVKQTGATKSKEIIEVIKSPTGKYYLIVSSLHNIESAKQRLAELKAKGHDSAKIVRSDKKIRISLKDYKDKANALKDLKKYRKDHAGLWVLKY